MATFLVVTFNVGPIAFPEPRSVTVERSTTATGPWTMRGQVSVTNEIGYFYDNTIPFDTPVWYRITWDPDVAGDIIGPFSLAGSGNVVLSDPNRPWADIEFGFCDAPQSLVAQACTPGGNEFVWSRFGGNVRRASVGLFDRLDSETPADIYARRKNLDSGAIVLTKTLAASQQMYELFTAGGPLFLRAPAEYGPTDYYVQPGDLEDNYLSERIDQRFPHRLWSFPYTVVDPVFTLQQGTDCANWCAVKDTFPTFGDLNATGDTWGDVAAGTTVCP